MDLNEMASAVSALAAQLKPAAAQRADEVPFSSTVFDRSEQDNGRWIELIAAYLSTAKRFEIHCWNEETEWIELALRYGERKQDEWQYGKIIAGPVTPQFARMLLSLPKPEDSGFENKMTPFFSVFLDDDFQSCHYGTENYHR